MKGREWVLELEFDVVFIVRKIIDFYYKVSGKEWFFVSVN